MIWWISTITAWRHWGRAAVLAGVAGMVSACASRGWQGFPTSVNPVYAWPGTPEPPRVAYVQSISNHEDLFQIGGFFRRVTRLLAGPPDTRLAKPYAVALHPDGGLLVTDPARGVVHFYEWSRRVYVALGPDRPGGLPSPVGVAALPNGEILVSESRGGTVERFSKSGKWLGTFAGVGVLGRPAGIAVDPDRGRVYVADVTQHRIAVFGLEGTFVRAFGQRGGEPGQFNYPTHLALGPEGTIAVTDSLNFRVEIFEPDGAFVRTFGRLGDSPGQFSKPKGIAVDSAGNVMVVEGLYDAVEFFDAEANLLLNLGGPGSDPGQFWLPAGVALDRKENLLFVADSHNSRVQVFRVLPNTASGLLSTSPPGEEKGPSNAP